MSQLDFAALMCSRLCHDLVSPVGAINNGLELLAEGDDPAMREQVIDLLNKSVAQTSSRLQFFRLAFGAAGGFSDSLDLSEVRSAIESLIEGSRITLSWSVDGGTGSKHLIKTLLNMALLVSESMIRGGILTVSEVKTDESRTFTISGTGDRIIMQEAILNVLRGEQAPDGMEARTVPAVLAREVAAELGAKLVIEGVSSEAASLSLTV